MAGSSTINLGSSYIAGDTIEIEDGILIQFAAGVFEGESKTFTVKAYSPSIDDPETGTWGGKWFLNSRKSSNAMNNDLENVCNLFIANETSGVDGIAELIREDTDKFTEKYTEANPGIVCVIIHNYENIIENINSKIENEERRLALIESRLNQKYSQLEVLLGQLEGQSNFIESFIDNLINSKLT